MAILKVVSGDDAGRSFEIDRDEVSLGRSSDNAFPIVDGSVSGHHAVVVREGRRFTLRDLGSTNGTRLNGVKISEARLNAGDTLCIGSVNLVIEGDDIEPDAREEIPPPVLHAPVETASVAELGGTPPSGAFQKKKSSRGVLASVGIVLLIVLLALLGWLAFGLFSK